MVGGEEGALLSMSLVLFCILVSVLGQNVASNTDRLQKLKELSHIEKDQAAAVLSRIESETKSILEMGDDIAERRDRIQADRERVTANHRRTADLISK